MKPRCCPQCGPKCVIHNDIINITSWKQYAKQTMNTGRVYKYFDTLLHRQKGAGDILHCNAQKCAHNYFHNHNVFLSCLYLYMVDDLKYKLILEDHGIISCAFKDGICNDCCLQFIIYTNGFYNVFNTIETKMNCGKLKLFRSEFNNSRIILCQNPLFWKSILLKSNIKCLSQIFHLFFVEYLQNVNWT
eukprot:444666_1